MKLGVNNNNTVFMIMKSTYACNEIEITSSEHSSVMLSSCIRFSNSIICEYKEIISHGPSSIDKTKEFVCDFMVCASYFYEKDGTLDLLYDSEEYEFSNYTVKMNEKCFVFPYSDIATHFISPKLMSFFFNELENNKEHATDIIHKIYKISAINRSKQKLFLTRMIQVVKKFSSSINEQMLDDIISALLSAYKPKRIIQTIVRDKDEPNIKLYKLLLQKFSYKYWKDVMFFEDQVALIVMKDPNFLPLIFSNAKDLPGVMKYVCTILRTGFTYEEKPIQREMLNCIILFSSTKENSKIIKDILPFEYLQQLLLVSNEEIQIKVFQLMCIIHKHFADYIQFSWAFNQVIALLCKSSEVWIHVFNLVEANKKETLPLLSVYTVTNVKSSSADYIELMKRGINLLIASVDKIIDSKECVTLISSRLPLIFNVYHLFSEKIEIDGNQDSRTSIIAREFTEFQDSFWNTSNAAKTEKNRTRRIRIENQLAFYRKIVKKILLKSGVESVDFKNLDAASLLSFVKSTGVLNLFVCLIPKTDV